MPRGRATAPPCGHQCFSRRMGKPLLPHRARNSSHVSWASNGSPIRLTGLSSCYFFFKSASTGVPSCLVLSRRLCTVARCSRFVCPSLAQRRLLAYKLCSCVGPGKNRRARHLCGCEVTGLYASTFPTYGCTVRPVQLSQRWAVPQARLEHKVVPQGPAASLQ